MGCSVLGGRCPCLMSHCLRRAPILQVHFVHLGVSQFLILPILLTLTGSPLCPENQSGLICAVFNLGVVFVLQASLQAERSGDRVNSNAELYLPQSTQGGSLCDPW